MKKARIVLSIIIILAVTGGMLAFKVGRPMPVTYYFCNTAYRTCQSTWTFGAWITTIYDAAATITVPYAVTTTTANGQPCLPNCTYSNTVWIESGF
jgi:hypothetical protein